MLDLWYFVFTEACSNKEDITIVICPGLANSSECCYIKAFTLQANSHGYRVAVLNLLGVLDEELTTARIFTFGKYVTCCRYEWL